MIENTNFVKKFKKTLKDIIGNVDVKSVGEAKMGTESEYEKEMIKRYEGILGAGRMFGDITKRFFQFWK